MLHYVVLSASDFDSHAQLTLAMLAATNAKHSAEQKPSAYQVVRDIGTDRTLCIYNDTECDAFTSRLASASAGGIIRGSSDPPPPPSQIVTVPWGQVSFWPMFGSPKASSTVMFSGVIDDGLSDGSSQYPEATAQRRPEPVLHAIFQVARLRRSRHQSRDLAPLLVAADVLVLVLFQSQEVLVGGSQPSPVSPNERLVLNSVEWIRLGRSTLDAAHAAAASPCVDTDTRRWSEAALGTSIRRLRVVLVHRSTPHAASEPVHDAAFVASTWPSTKHLSPFMACDTGRQLRVDCQIVDEARCHVIAGVTTVMRYWRHVAGLILGTERGEGVAVTPPEGQPAAPIMPVTATNNASPVDGRTLLSEATKTMPSVFVAMQLLYRLQCRTTIRHCSYADYFAHWARAAANGEAQPCHHGGGHFAAVMIRLVGRRALVKVLSAPSRQPANAAGASSLTDATQPSRVPLWLFCGSTTPIPVVKAFPVCQPKVASARRESTLRELGRCPTLRHPDVQFYSSSPPRRVFGSSIDHTGLNGLLQDDRGQPTATYWILSLGNCPVNFRRDLAVLPPGTIFSEYGRFAVFAEIVVDFGEIQSLTNLDANRLTLQFRHPFTGATLHARCGHIRNVENDFATATTMPFCGSGSIYESAASVLMHAAARNHALNLDPPRWDPSSESARSTSAAARYVAITVDFVDVSSTWGLDHAYERNAPLQRRVDDPAALLSGHEVAMSSGLSRLIDAKLGTSQVTAYWVSGVYAHDVPGSHANPDVTFSHFNIRDPRRYPWLSSWRPYYPPMRARPWFVEALPGAAATVDYMTKLHRDDAEEGALRRIMDDVSLQLCGKPVDAAVETEGSSSLRPRMTARPETTFDVYEMGVADARRVVEHLEQLALRGLPRGVKMLLCQSDPVMLPLHDTMLCTWPSPNWTDETSALANFANVMTCSIAADRFVEAELFVGYCGDAVSTITSSPFRPICATLLSKISNFVDHFEQFVRRRVRVLPSCHVHDRNLPGSAMDGPKTIPHALKWLAQPLFPSIYAEMQEAPNVTRSDPSSCAAAPQQQMDMFHIFPRTNGGIAEIVRLTTSSVAAIAARELPPNWTPFESTLGPSMYGPKGVAFDTRPLAREVPTRALQNLLARVDWNTVKFALHDEFLIRSPATLRVASFTQQSLVTMALHDDWRPVFQYCVHDGKALLSYHGDKAPAPHGWQPCGDIVSWALRSPMLVLLRCLSAAATGRVVVDPPEATQGASVAASLGAHQMMACDDDGRDANRGGSEYPASLSRLWSMWSTFDALRRAAVADRCTRYQPMSEMAKYDGTRQRIVAQFGASLTEAEFVSVALSQAAAVEEEEQKYVSLSSSRGPLSPSLMAFQHRFISAIVKMELPPVTAACPPQSLFCAGIWPALLGAYASTHTHPASSSRTNAGSVVSDTSDPDATLRRIWSWIVWETCLSPIGLEGSSLRSSDADTFPRNDFKGRVLLPWMRKFLVAGNCRGIGLSPPYSNTTIDLSAIRRIGFVAAIQSYWLRRVLQSRDTARGCVPNLIVPIRSISSNPPVVSSTPSSPPSSSSSSRFSTLLVRTVALTVVSSCASSPLLLCGRAHGFHRTGLTRLTDDVWSLILAFLF